MPCSLVHLARALLCLLLISVGFATAQGPLNATEDAKLIASDPEAFDEFGVSAALSGGTAIIGARGGNPPGWGWYYGAAYVFVNSGAGWNQQSELTASDPGNTDSFGDDVSLYGDTAIVGAAGAYHSGVNQPGAAYVFVRTGSSWSQQDKLIASDPNNNDGFGRAVAIHEETAFVGAPNKSNGAGAAYTFVRNGSNWIQQAKITPLNSPLGDRFGTSVAVSGNTAVIGSTGSAYVFEYDGLGWNQTKKLKVANSAGSFGQAVSLSGDTIVVGAAQVAGGGAAYVFVRSGENWVQQAELTASDSLHADEFGASVGILGDTVTVGARNSSSSEASQSGSAYVFMRSGTSWIQHKKLTASDAGPNDRFGDSVALSESAIIAGASQEDPLGINNAGSAYVFSSSCKLPLKTVRVSVKRVLSSQQQVPSGWGTVDDPTNPISQWVKKASSILEAQAGISLHLDEVVDIVDPVTPNSWFDVNVTENPTENKVKELEDAAIADPCYFRWRTDAINVYLVNSRFKNQGALVCQIGGTSSFPDGPHKEIILLRQPILNDEVGLAHELGHYFNLYHTFETSFGAEQQMTCVATSPDCASTGDKVCDTPADPNDLVMLESLYGIGSCYGSNSSAPFVALSRNIMSYYGGITPELATVSDGQCCRAKAALLAQRQHVLVDSAIVQAVCTWTYLGHSKSGVFGPPLLVGTGTLLPQSTMTLNLTNALPLVPAYLLVGSSALTHAFFGGVLVPLPTWAFLLVTDGSGKISFSYALPAGLPSGVPVYMQCWVADLAPTPFGWSASNALKAIAP